MLSLIVALVFIVGFHLFARRYAKQYVAWLHRTLNITPEDVEKYR